MGAVQIRIAAIFSLAVLWMAVIGVPSYAQSKCTTTLECAQQAVEAAAKAEAAAQSAQAKISAELKAFEDILGGGRILAFAFVKNRALVSSSEGVLYNPATGEVSFKNPKNLRYVPIISDYQELHYMTEKVYIRDKQDQKFTVWQTTLDTGDRNQAPISFTALVVGFENKSAQ